MSDEKKIDDMFPNLTPAEIEQMEDAVIRNQQNFGIPSEEDMAIWEQEALSEAARLQITETDTIQAKIAELPITDLTQDFIVEVMTPIQLVPRILAFSLELIHVVKHTDPHVMFRDCLKQELLREWHAHFDNEELSVQEKLPDWVRQVNKVELIECDLLVPKEKK
jgi:hypothetical protein